MRIDGVNVLIVDDQADGRSVLTMLLEQAGAIVVTASSAREVLERLSRARADVLVRDLAMPDQDGYDLIRRVRDDLGHAPRDLPAVALSAYVATDDASLQAGFQVHLPKPVDVHELVSIIARLSRPN